MSNQWWNDEKLTNILSFFTGTQNLFLISGDQLDAINRLLVSHNNIKQAAINKANTVRTEAEKIFLAPFLEALQPLLLAATNPLQSLVGNLGPVPVVDPAVEVESKYISLLVCGQAS